MFNGRLKITVIEAKELKATPFMTRHTQGGILEPYVAIDVDEVACERTSTKAKTNEPKWNETFTTELLRNADEVGFTVFHDATIPPDDFVANCKISLSELIEKEEQPLHQLEVSPRCFLKVNTQNKIGLKTYFWAVKSEITKSRTSAKYC